MEEDRSRHRMVDPFLSLRLPSGYQLTARSPPSWRVSCFRACPLLRGPAHRAANLHPKRFVGVGQALKIPWLRLAATIAVRMAGMSHSFLWIVRASVGLRSPRRTARTATLRASRPECPMRSLPAKPVR